MNKKWFYCMLSVLSVSIGSLFLFIAAQMWLGAVLIAPLGFLFGLGEMSSYGTLREGLINLWWHTVPGLAGGGLSLVFMILTTLLLWGGISAWHHTKETR